MGTTNRLACNLVDLGDPVTASFAPSPYFFCGRRYALVSESKQETTDLRDQRYLKIILDRLETCKTYLPKFGTGQVVTLKAFKSMYGEDPFYSWFGLDKVVPEIKTSQT